MTMPEEPPQSADEEVEDAWLGELLPEEALADGAEAPEELLLLEELLVAELLPDEETPDEETPDEEAPDEGGKLLEALLPEELPKRGRLLDAELLEELLPEMLTTRGGLLDGRLLDGRLLDEELLEDSDRSTFAATVAAACDKVVLELIGM